MTDCTSSLFTSSAPQVGIVILNWNGWQDTVECLDSLRGLTYSNYEVIVVDNASTNDSVAQIKERFPGIKIIESPENGGFSKGNNLGIRAFMEAGADFIWLLNNDTTVSTLALSELVRAARQNPHLGIVGSVLYEYDQPGVIQAWGGGKFRPFLATTSHYKKSKVIVDHIIGASMFIRREVAEQIGILDERFFFFMEDTEYSLRARQAGWLLGVAEQSRVYHKGGSSLKSNPSDSKNLKSDSFYVKAVGTYMRVAGRPVTSVYARFLAIIIQRIVRGQWNRVLSLTSNYWHGYTGKIPVEK